MELQTTPGFDADSQSAENKVGEMKIFHGKSFAAAVKKDKIEIAGEDLKPISQKRRR